MKTKDLFKFMNEVVGKSFVLHADPFGITIKYVGEETGTRLLYSEYIASMVAINIQGAGGTVEEIHIHKEAVN